MKSLIGRGCAVASAVALGCGLTASAEVPSDYTQYTYIQFGMGAYVDVGMPIDGHRLQFKFEDSSYYNDRHYIGTDRDWHYPNFTSYNNHWCWGVSGNSGGEDGNYSSGPHEVDYNNDLKIYIDGELLEGGTLATTSGGSNLLIGRRSGAANFAGRFYYLNIFDREGNEVAHLVPVRNNDTKECGFYDTVRNCFCGNSGSGLMWTPESVTGNVPPEYTELSFVQFNAGAYVDTGMPIENYRIKFKFEDFGYYNDRHYIGTVNNWHYPHFTAYNNQWCWGVSSNNGGADGSYSSGVHEVDYNNDSKIYIDGDLLEGGTLATSSGGANLLIGRRENAVNFAGRFYYLTLLEQDGTEVARFVPVRRNDTGECGFYDVVRDIFRGNAGKGLLWSPEKGSNTKITPEQKTSALYVAKGLVAQWDGIENAGVGAHDATTNVWVDLTGHGWDATSGLSGLDLNWGADSYIFTRDTTCAFAAKTGLPSALGTNWTIEVFLKRTTRYCENYSGIFGAHGNNGTGLIGFQCDNTGTTGLGSYQRQIFTLPTFNANEAFPACKPLRIVVQLNGDARTTYVYLNDDEPFQTGACVAGTDLRFDNPNFYIGNAYDGSQARTFDGEIHALRIYDRVLTSEELDFNHRVDLYRFCNARAPRRPGMMLFVR